MKKSQKVLSLGISLFVLSVGCFVAFIFYSFLKTPPQKDNAEVVIYELLPQTSFLKAAEDLERMGIIRNKDLFNVYAKVTRQRGKVKVGEYGFRRNMLPAEVLQILISGKSIAKPLTVSEGLNIFEIALLYEKLGFGQAVNFLKLVRDPIFAEKLLGFKASSLEGYLYPETYQITKFTSAKDLITSMVRRFQLVFDETQKQSVVANLNPKEVVTLASIIEKETGAPQERSMISAVFHNRLQIKMKLQTDPTIIYGKAIKSGEVEISITRKDLTEPTAYNTYVISGLPPGPIANPGREALIAAVKPAPVKYLYFVSRNDGTHIFSETYTEHAKAVREYQMNARARAGKSWRDLKSPAPGVSIPANPAATTTSPVTEKLKN